MPSVDMEPTLPDIPHHGLKKNAQTPTVSPIDTFMNSPWPEHYQALAKQARKLLKRELDNAQDADRIEVHFKITCRAKSPQSLSLKLKDRNKTTNYKDVDSILKDVKDIAGVRVVLYIPNKAQMRRVEKAIKGIWSTGVEKILHGIPDLSCRTNSSRIEDENDSGNDDDAADNATNDEEFYKPRHAGYQASHYRVLMPKEYEEQPYVHRENDWVEIQVVSALVHVWAEVSHDVMYKTLAYGNPTKQECRILDALRGMITSGELLLEEYRESVTKRTHARWKHPVELTMWLRKSDVMKQKGNKSDNSTWTSLADHFGDMGIDILYRFLEKIDKNYPVAVRDELEAMEFPAHPEASLEAERATFGSAFRPPQGLLAPFCIISRFMKRLPPWKAKIYNTQQKCSAMMDAFILLQEFCGTTAAAKEYLVKNVRPQLNDNQINSFEFVLNNPLRRDFLRQIERCPVYNHAPELEAAWDWFFQQVAENKLCGLLFRLATMGVPAKEMGNPAEESGFGARIRQLRIKSLAIQSEDSDDQ